MRGVSKLAQLVHAEERDEASLRELAQDVVAAYARNVAFIGQLAASHGFAMRFYWQPTLFTKKSVTAYERRQRDGRERQLRSLHLASNAAIRDSEELRANDRFHDLSDVLDDVPDSVYLDYCHLGEDGNRLVASAIAETAVAALQQGIGPSWDGP